MVLSLPPFGSPHCVGPSCRMWPNIFRWRSLKRLFEVPVNRKELAKIIGPSWPHKQGRVSGLGFGLALPRLFLPLDVLFVRPFCAGAPAEDMVIWRQPMYCQPINMRPYTTVAMVGGSSASPFRGAEEHFLATLPQNTEIYLSSSSWTDWRCIVSEPYVIPSSSASYCLFNNSRT